VQAYAEPDRPGSKPFGDRLRGVERSRRGREGNKEGVSLGVDLDAALGSASIPYDPPMLVEYLRVGLGAEFVEELRRALDVREQERDGANRRIAPQVQVIMRRFWQRV